MVQESCHREDACRKLSVTFVPKISWMVWSYRERFQKLGDMDDYNQSMFYYRLALDITSNMREDHDHYAQLHSDLGQAYYAICMRTRRIEDLEASLACFKTAMEETRPGHPELAKRQTNLAASNDERYERLDDPSNLRTSIELYRAALSITPPDYPDIASREASLADSHLKLFDRFGNLADLETALELCESAYKKTPTDLEESLHFRKLVLNNVPSDSTDYSSFQSNIARSYLLRYERFGEPSDLQASMEFSKGALDSTPTDHPDLPNRYAELACSYLYRHQKLSDPNDLETSLMYQKLALKNTPADHTDLHIHQWDLATGYQTRYRQYGALSDLAEALKFYTMALEGTPKDNPDVPNKYASLAECYRWRFDELRDANDIEDSVQMGLSSTAKTSNVHFALPVRLLNLSRAYFTKYELFKDPADKESCLHFSQKSIGKFPAASIAETWQVAVSIARLTSQLSSPLALEAYKRAFNILPELLWIGSSLPTRHHTLVEYDINGTVALAAASAIESREFGLAVEYLEQGLAITHQQSLKLKGENVSLTRDHPNDAAQLKELSLKLLQVGNPNLPEDATWSEGYHILASTRNTLIERIRDYDGYTTFLLPASYEVLSHAASGGPVVLVTSTSLRADALLILRPSSAPIHVELPRADLESSNKHLETLRSALADCRIRYRNTTSSAESIRYGRPSNPFIDDSRDKFQEVLSWLWECVVEPIFITLAQHGIHGGRIWWCTSGPFNYLPVHAAAPVGNTFIQSYTSTLEGLVKARKKEPVIPREPFTAVGITSIPERPGLNLPLVREELKQVALALKDIPMKQLLDSEATVSNVTAAVQTSSWLHLACHGIQDTKNPLQSHLILSDGNLTLESILNTHLPHAQFAFLSACETAMGDRKLANEAMHFAGGFIAAGFRGAIGTLWSRSDADGPSVAEVVYNKMCEKGEGPDLALAAEGLHLAIQKLRRQGVPPHRWIPFVHFGV